ncbi:hypothetical protein [Metasolibacillus meyeri]|uniref:hypothetical protein n=1 Tax=Metasolibacillus meyeri TaxID=1071052 RepID=UPI000D2F4B1B|nr:hypothetical protein [Metasolibacillus meyeri]
MQKAAHTHCGECRQRFSAGEIVYYTWYENDTFYSNCKAKLNTLVSVEYLDWQQRIAKKKAGEIMSIHEKLRLANDVIKKYDIEKNVLRVTVDNVAIVEILIDDESLIVSLEGVQTENLIGGRFNKMTRVIVDNVDIRAFHN